MTKEALREYRNIKTELVEMEKLRKTLTALDYDIDELYLPKKTALLRELERIEQAIETLGPTERTLMRLRYIEGLSWQEVCDRIHYSWQQTHRIHANALIKLREV